MRVSNYFSSTLKEAPLKLNCPATVDAACRYIKKLASGLYTWMPLGLRVLLKVEILCGRNGSQRRNRVY